MILRHVTLKRRVSEIIRVNALLSAAALGFRPNAADSDFVAFELNPTSNVLVNIFPIIKSFPPFDVINDGDQLELLFDGEQMIRDGIEIQRLSQHKAQLQVFVGQQGFTQEDYEIIGEFVFVRSSVSLKYLIDESKAKLHEYTSYSGDIET